MESREEIDFIMQLPQNSREATKYILQILIKKVHPVIQTICDKLRSCSEVYEVIRVRDIYSLCCNQIKKCITCLLDVFRLEYSQGIFLQESRQCNLERLQWCINRLISINIYLGKISNNLLQDEDNTADDSINVTVMYFVNWIDHIFELLNKLSDTIYRTDYKDNDDLYILWKNDMVEYVSELNVSIDELLLSAMTLCKYSLHTDQHIIKARCQVVFRETKALLSGIIEGDLSSTVKIKPDTLKLPIMPSNVNILIDMLRNVLYVLETNTNTALLALLIYCFSNSMSPIDLLKLHFKKSKKGTCSCLDKIDGDITEDCLFIKEFDFYNERLLQIGSFAVSCSSDQNRTLKLRSGLASLEGLDPHLVPAIMMSPDSHHSTLLINSWHQEVQQIRDSVFLIVDPAAFVDKSKQMLRQKLLEMLKSNVYNNAETCSVINIGCVVYDFFEVYEQNEPDALTHRDNLSLLLADLKKVKTECKIVSNLLSSANDFLYDVKTPQNKKVSLEQLVKRLKLLYTIVNRINTILNPNDNDDQLYDGVCDEEDELRCNDATHTIYKNDATYANSPKKPNDLSRTIFARTLNIIRSPKKNFPLANLTKNLRIKKCDEISFSVQLDRLFNETNDENHNKNEAIFIRDRLDKIREPSILYNFSPAKRSSMRRVILNRHCMSNDKLDESKLAEESDSFMDDTSLQITDVLNQINDLTSILSTNNISRWNLTNKNILRSQTNEKYIKDKGRRNVLTLNINNENTTLTKHVWNIPVNSCVLDTPVNSCVSDTPVNSCVSDAPVNSCVSDTPVNNCVSDTPVNSCVSDTPVNSCVSDTPVNSCVSDTPVNSFVSDTRFDNSELASNISTPPSNVTTMERIYDLDLVESKLNSLKSQLETSV